MSAFGHAAVASGFAVDTTGVDRTDAEVVGVTLSWGDARSANVLGVKHLAASEELVLGEEDGCDFLVPKDVLGADSVRVLERRGQKTLLVVPQGAKLVVDGRISSDVRVELLAGQTATLDIGSFSLAFRIAAAAKPAVLAMGQKTGGVLGSLGGSALLHASLIAFAGLVCAKLDTIDATDDSAAAQIQSFALDASAQREEVPPPPAPSEGAAGSSTAASGPEGAVGIDTSKHPHGKVAYQGDPARPQVYTREQAMSQAESFGANRLLAQLNALHTSALNFGEEPNGPDARTARGDMFMGDIHDPFGSGFGPRGPGDGADGPGGWVKMTDTFGPLGKCTRPDGKCSGIAHSVGPDMDPHAPVHVSMRSRPGIPDTSSLPRDVIQREIGLHYGNFRMCYLTGVQANPSLAGNVRVTFVIGRDGAVTMATDAGSDLPDANVKSCVASTFKSLSFPAPKTGTVTVSYGFSFSAEQNS